MTSCLTSMDTISLSRTVLEIFDFKVFRVWPWPLTSEGHLGSNICIPFESPYITSYSGQVGALVLLDMSAAFDTVDHQIMSDVLHYCFDIRDDALTWFHSYFDERSQVVLTHCSSDWVLIDQPFMWYYKDTPGSYYIKIHFSQSVGKIKNISDNPRNWLIFLGNPTYWLVVPDNLKDCMVGSVNPIDYF